MDASFITPPWLAYPAHANIVSPGVDLTIEWLIWLQQESFQNPLVSLEFYHFSVSLSMWLILLLSLPSWPCLRGMLDSFVSGLVLWAAECYSREMECPLKKMSPCGQLPFLLSQCGYQSCRFTFQKEMCSYANFRYWVFVCENQMYLTWQMFLVAVFEALGTEGSKEYSTRSKENIKSMKDKSNCKCHIVGNWTCFSLLKTFHPSFKGLLQF